MSVIKLASNENEAIEVINNILSDMKLNLSEYALNQERCIEEVLQNLSDPNGIYREDEHTIRVCVDFLVIDEEDGFYAVNLGAREGIWTDVKIDRETMTVIEFDFDYAVECSEMNKEVFYNWLGKKKVS